MERLWSYDDFMHQKRLLKPFFAFALAFTGSMAFADVDGALTPQSPAELEFALGDKNFDGRWQTFGEREIFRAKPRIEGVPVEGQDHVVEYDRYGFSRFHPPKQLVPSGHFALTESDAIEAAKELASRLPPRLKMQLEVAPTAMPVWTPHHGELKAAFRVRLPSMRVENLLDVWVDAEDGHILRIERAAKTFDAPARLFQFEPAPYKNDLALAKDAKSVIVKDLLSGDVGSHVKGEHFETKNCCPFVRCPDEKQSCEENEFVCASESDPNARPYIVAHKIDSSLLGLGGRDIPRHLYVASIECARLPKATLQQDHDGRVGFFQTAIDENDLNALDDDYSEVQAYYSLSSFFDYIKRIKGDNSFCLRPQAMECDGLGRATKDINGNPTHSTVIFVNQLLPYPSLDPNDAEAEDSILSQVAAGLGRSIASPIIINTLTRVENAAYVPASGLPLKTEPSNLDEALGHLIQPYDFLIFFQGLNDYGYDGSIAFHEFTHAVIQTLAPDLATIVADPQGLNNQPGAFNEAAADYFSASFRNDPSIGLYASSSPTGFDGTARKISEAKRCPFNITGEIHDDSLMWSSALWNIRANILKRLGQLGVDAWDRVILEAIAKAQTEDDFAAQAQRIEDGVRRNRILASSLAMIQSVLNNHGVRSCQRDIPLSYLNDDGELAFHKHPYLLHTSPMNLGFDNFSPPPANFVLTLPPATGSFKIHWQQSGSLDSLVAGAPATTRNRNETLVAIATERTPLSWEYNTRSAFPRFDGKDVDANSPSFSTRAISNEEGWFIEKVLPDLSCENRVFYVSFVNPHQGLDNDVMTHAEVTIAINTDKRAECTAQGVPSLVLAADTEDQGSIAKDMSDHPGSGGCGCSLSQPIKNPSAALSEALAYLGLVLFAMKSRRDTGQ